MLTTTLSNRPLPSRQSQLKAKPSNAAQQPKSAEDVWTLSESVEYSLAGSKYGFDKVVAKAADVQAGGLSGQPKVSIERPILLVHGFLGHGKQFESLTDQLTRDGSNGGAPIYVKKGQFFEDPHCTVPTVKGAEHKVFCMVHSGESCPEEVANDMELAVAAINTQNAADIDIAAHSMGGLGARVFLDRGNKVGKLAMVGTPNQGSRAAMLTKAALKNDIGWATSLAGVTGAAVAALDWMVPVVNGNEELENLNSRWELQEQNTEQAIVMGSTDFVTISSFENWGTGDGLIEEKSLSVGDVPVWKFEGTGRKAHYTMMNDPDIYFGLSSFFNWEQAA